ncbi:MAG: hypothetical protein WDO12_12000 [Pseudomonadota bacterium]
MERKPTWLGYLHVADVDAATRAIVADGGKVLMPRMDLPVGKIAMVADPMGSPFYVMDPIPATRQACGEERCVRRGETAAHPLERAREPGSCAGRRLSTRSISTSNSTK